MGKDLGNKHVCFKCGTKFYDLRKPEPLCPKCGADQRESPALKAPPERRQKGPPKPVPVPVEPEEPLDDEVEEAEGEDDAEDADDDSDDA